MNRINHYCRNAIANHLICKRIYLNLRNPITELMCQKAIGEVHIWRTIRETIRKGYKRVEE